MSTLTGFISSGGGGGGLYGGVIEEIVLNKSQTWVPHQNGTVNIYVIGGGGAGGKVSGVSGNNFVTGGGAGGLCIHKSLDVTTSGSFTVICGAGGLAPFSSNASDAPDGGNSTVAGTGLSSTLTANGGSGGNKGTNPAAAVLGGAGGSASNGNFANRTGGTGGSVSANITTGVYGSAVTGGGAVAIKSLVGYAGGSVTAGNIDNQKIVTGGAGIGGTGGNKSATGELSYSTNGGSANFEAYDAVSGNNYNGIGSAQGNPYAFSFQYREASLVGARHAVGGSGATTGSSNRAGHGGGGIINQYPLKTAYQEAPQPSMGAGGGGCRTATADNVAGFGGAFAGGGGLYYTYAGQLNRNTGLGGCGGGGGGTISTNQVGIAGGTGGNGLVIIHYTAVA